MAITTDDFNKVWASTSPLTPYSFSESQYKEGWNFIGGTPPSRQMWDFLQKNNDEKMQYLLNNFDNYLPLSGGTVTGDLTVTGALDGTASGNLPLSGGNITGDLSVTGTITGNVTGNVTGNADTATNATNDANGNPIASTYLPAVVGAVIAFAGSTSPTGWLLCDGSAVSRTDYAALFAVIGTTYGAGDGTDTFNLPNLIDKFVQGNSVAGTEHSAGLPNITGTGTYYTTWLSPSGAVYNQSNGNKHYAGDGSSLGQGIWAFDASLSNSIYGNSTTVQPPSVTMRYIIKY